MKIIIQYFYQRMFKTMKYLSFGLFLIPIVATAQLRVATVFSNNMLLQRDEPIAVWGKAVPGNKVEVVFGKTNSPLLFARYWE